MRALRTYLTTFVLFGSWSVVVVLLVGLLIGQLELQRALVAAVAIGAVVTLSLGTIQVLGTRAVPAGHPTNPSQRREVHVVGGPLLDQRVHRALTSLPATVVEADPVAGRWVARTSVNWRTFGEHVVVQLHGDPSAPVAEVTSRPRVRSTQLDYGRGYDVVDRVATSLTS